MSLYGPDGKPLGGPRVSVAGGTATVEHHGERASASPAQLLMAMARAERDGMSQKQIIAEFGLMGPATNPLTLNRALKRGHDLLKQAIARGLEPAETERRHAVDEIEPDD